MRMCYIGSIVVASILSCSAAAFAQEASGAERHSALALGVDEVLLKNGGMVRGTILSVEPDKEVVIQVSGMDKPRTIPWAEVETVNRGRYSESPEAPPLPGYSTPPPEATPDTGTEGVVKLHIESDDPDVQLHRYIGSSVAYGGGHTIVVGHSEMVCGTPCDSVVDGSRGDEFFFTGAGIPSSKRFGLRSYSGDVTVDVEAGSGAGMWGGVSMISLGGVSMLMGVVFTIMGFADDLMEDFQVGGPIMLGGGAAMLGGGIALVVTSTTDYSFRERESSARLAPLSPRWYLGEF